MRKTEIIINTEKLEVSAGILRALTHPLRMKILEYIDANENDVNVNKIYKDLNLEQSITSQHLRILRKAEIVTTCRYGKFIHYQVDYSKLKSAKKALGIFFD